MEIRLIVDAKSEPEIKYTVNEQLLRNIHLSDLINRFERLLDRVKELELSHLIEPVESAVCKLKELQALSKKLACDYYDGHPCANKSCCNDVDLTEKAQVTSCGCENSECENLQESFDKCSERCKECQQKSVSSRGDDECNEKCNPCECATDAFGKRIKTRDCRLASQSRRDSRKSANDCDTSDCRRPPEDDADEGDIVVQRRFSNSRLEIHTNFTDMKFSVNKENTVVQDTTFVNVRERNQAVSCNLSSDYTSSSSGEFDTECSSDMIVFESNYDECLADSRKCYTPPEGLRMQTCGCSDGSDECTRSDTKQLGGSCGCGRHRNNREVGDQQHQPMACPCGCGDLAESLPRAANKTRRCAMRSNCKCENCGNEIIDLYNLPRTVSCKRNPLDYYSRITHQRCRGENDDDDTDTDEKISFDEQARDETIAR